MGDLIAGVDIGTSKVCAVIGGVNKNLQLEVSGRGMASCSGLKKGVIVDIEKTAAGIRSAVEEAESAAGVKVESAFVNIYGMHVDVVNNKSWLGIANGNREITRRDVDTLLHSVGNIDVPEDRQIIDVIPRQYIIDGYDEIMDPTGMAGTRLEVDADIVVGKITSVQNILKSLERADIQIDGIVAGAFACGEICLTTDERDMGVVLLDVGGGITDISVFQGKRLVFYESIPVGGDHITGDIAIGLKISNAEAEKIKRQFELALTSLIKNDQEIMVYDINENIRKSVRVSEVIEIIEARVYEIFSLCRNRLAKAESLVKPNGGVVLTGAGISYVDGCRQLAQEVFEVPVRVVQAGQLQGVSRPEFITAAGIIRHVACVKKGASRISEVKFKKNMIVQPKTTILDRIINIFKEMF